MCSACHIHDWSIWNSSLLILHFGLFFPKCGTYTTHILLPSFTFIFRHQFLTKDQILDKAAIHGSPFQGQLLPCHTCCWGCCARDPAVHGCHRLQVRWGCKLHVCHSYSSLCSYCSRNRTGLWEGLNIWSLTLI